MKNVIEITQELIRRPSITPLEAGCLDLMQAFLESHQFVCHRLKYGEVDNLYARWGDAEPNFCFAGHVDVVPEGDLSGWIADPFAGDIVDDVLYGRGAVDMKGAIGAFMAAAIDHIQVYPPKGSISFLITCDEEGPAFNGTRKVLRWLKEQEETITACLVGEPTNPKRVGDMVKVGRRGSLNATLTVFGKAGHVAYPDLAHNPIPPLLSFLEQLIKHPLDKGMDHFDPSHVEVTSIDVGNRASNVIPEQAVAKFNIRFNPQHTGESLRDLLSDYVEQKISLSYDLALRVSGEAFYCPDSALQSLLRDSISHVCGHPPQFSTSGGTSDARFIKDICPVIEFGLINETAHQTNEQVAIAELIKLKNVYQEILRRFFA